MYDAYRVILLYKALYVGVFSGITKALQLLEAGGTSEATKALMDAKREAEALYNSADPEDHFPPPLEILPYEPDDF